MELIDDNPCSLTNGGSQIKVKPVSVKINRAITIDEFELLIRARFPLPPKKLLKLTVDNEEFQQKFQENYFILKYKYELSNAIIWANRHSHCHGLNKWLLGFSMRECHAFINPFEAMINGGDRLEPKTLQELKMIRLSSVIRRDENWFTNLQISKIICKWKKEGRSLGLTSKEILYVLQELDYYALQRVPVLDIQVADVDGTWISDMLIESFLRNELLDGIEFLENSMTGKDWHPGSDNLVWNLVHPALYSLIYGTSRSLPSGCGKLPQEFCGAGKIILTPGIPARYNGLFSDKFSWLPSEFQVHENGSVTIDSYINNLHPIRHKGLYTTLEKIFARFVPLFEKVLECQIQPRENRIKVSINQLQAHHLVIGFRFRRDPSSRLHNAPRVVSQLAEKFELPIAPPRVNLKGSKLQVFVKLANIMLTPERPSYPGGPFHLEGLKNENIVASGIYYYDIQNVTTSELMLRQAVREPEVYTEEQMAQIYGLRRGDPLNQTLGSVITKENRCLAFSNLYQHGVQPFELVDKTKPGHRKILVFFLVDPVRRITSTLTVPPQQLDWFLEKLRHIPPFDKLPLEILYHITSYLHFPLSLNKAKAFREELIAERKYTVQKVKNAFEHPLGQ